MAASARKAAACACGGGRRRQQGGGWMRLASICDVSAPPLPKPAGPARAATAGGRTDVTRGQQEGRATGRPAPGLAHP